MGHSLGNVDMPYFRAINNANDYPEDLRWHVSYYSEEERNNFERIMRSRIIDKNATLEMITLQGMQRKENHMQHWVKANRKESGMR